MTFAVVFQRDINIKFKNSSNNYIASNNTTKANVNNNKIGNKTSVTVLHNINKNVTFANNKDNFVLLIIKKVILCLKQLLILVMELNKLV